MIHFLPFQDFLFTRQHGHAPGKIASRLLFPGLLLLFTSCATRTSTIESAQNTSDQKNKSFLDSKDLLPVEGTDLSALLQSKEAKEAFDEYQKFVSKLSKPIDEEKLRESVPLRQRLLVGKHLFVYGVPEAANAVPEVFLKGSMAAWPDLVGQSFEAAGLIANPDDPGFPIGVPPVKSFNPAVNLAFQGKTRNAATCAMCHLGKLPDGRYSFGLPNNTLNSGRLALVFSYPIWSFDQNAKDPTKWDPRLIAAFTEMKERAKQSKVGGASFPDLTKVPKMINLTHFVTLVASLPRLGRGDQRDMLANSWGRGPAFYVALGTEDPMILSTPSLWGIESHKIKPYDLDKTRISSFFPAPDLETHMGEALYLNAGGDKKFAGIEWQIPLSDFVRTLKAPVNQNPKDETLFKSGESLFSKKCASCHSDSQGGSGKLIDAKAMALLPKYNAPYALSAKPSSPLSGKNFTNIEEMMRAEHPEYDYSKRGVRPRRLKGVWALDYLMTTGAVEGLDHALCLSEKNRKEWVPTTDESDSVHGDLCKKYDEKERLALKEFLSHWN